MGEVPDLQSVSWLPVLPHIIVAGGALLALIIPAFVTRRRDPTAAIAMAAVLAAGLVVPLSLTAGALGYGGSFVGDRLSVVLQVIALGATALVILMSLGQLPRERIAFPEYYGLLLLSTCGMMFLVVSNDLLMVFLSVELTSIPTYILAAMGRGRATSSEAALKYFLLGAFAVGFLLYGIALIFGATGTLRLDDIRGAIITGDLSVPMFLAGVGLALVGLGFKVALAPFHFWTPDVYQGAPTPVTAFIAAGPKAAIFGALIRVLVVGGGELQGHWMVVLWIMAVLTMTVGNVVAIVQSDVKRMLAYSSIAHAGYLLVAIVAGTDQGVQSISFYLIAYVLANVGAFATVEGLSRQGENPSIDDYKGLGFRQPLFALAMTIFMLSLGGIPPTAGFLAKVYVFGAAVQAGFVGLAVIGVLNSVVSVYYYLRIVVLMYMRDVEEPAEVQVTDWQKAALAVCAVATLALGVFPGWVLARTAEALPVLVGMR
jgi:NADH-quinone oxidoreductase subunit N